MKRMAIVGSGRWGRRLAASFKNHFDITHFASEGNVDNIISFSKLVPDALHCNLSQILDNNSIDAMAIAVPISELYNVGYRSINAGKHVFLEKPGAKSVHEIQSLSSMIKEGQVCHLGYHQLLDPSYIFFKKKLNSTKCNIKKIVFSWKKWGSFENDILLNLVTHELAMMIDLIGEPTEIINAHIKEDACNLHINIGNTEVIIDIDRRSFFNDKSVNITTSYGDFFWNSEPNLVDTQSDRFINSIEKQYDMSDLELGARILKVIEEIHH